MRAARYGYVSPIGYRQVLFPRFPQTFEDATEAACGGHGDYTRLRLQIGLSGSTSQGILLQGILLSGNYASFEFPPAFEAILPCHDVSGITESRPENPRQWVKGKVPRNCRGVQPP